MINSRLYEILSDARSDIDFERETGLIDQGILNSFDLLSIISEINESFEITIKPMDILPQNFNSAELMWKMIETYLNT